MRTNYSYLYNEKQLAAIRRMQSVDGYPLDAGTYSVEFTPTYRSTAKARFDRFMNYMQTRKNFTILSMSAMPDYIFVAYRHDGLK